MSSVRNELQSKTPVWEQQEKFLSRYITTHSPDFKQLSSVATELKCECCNAVSVGLLSCFPVSPADIYTLAAAVFQVQQTGLSRVWYAVSCDISCAIASGALEVASELFQLSHQLGDTNATYTYAQLLRTGQSSPHPPCKLVLDVSRSGLSD